MLGAVPLPILILLDLFLTNITGSVVEIPAKRLIDDRSLNVRPMLEIHIAFLIRAELLEFLDTP